MGGRREQSAERSIDACPRESRSKKPEDMRYLFAGDLLGQLIASSFGLKNV